MYRMNIATALDDNYAKYTYVLLLSLFKNNTDAEIYVYLLQDSLTKKSIQELEGLCSEYHNHLCLLDVDMVVNKSVGEFYVLDSMTDMSMRDYVKGLIDENIRLKSDLKSAIDSFQKLAGALK